MPADPDAAQIVITQDGPYLVSGGLPVSEKALSVDAEGETWDFQDLASNKPFCDGTHAHVGFKAHPAGAGSGRA